MRTFLHFFLFSLFLLPFIVKAQLKDTTTNKLDSVIQDKQGLLSIQNANLKKAKGPFTIEGEVIDPSNEEALAFVTLLFKGTIIGTKTDINGKFSFKLTTWPGDSLVISTIGYESQTILVDQSQNWQHLKIELARSSYSLKEMVIRYDPNPGLTLIKKVIKHKDENNFDKAENYKYEVYNKLELDITRIPKGAFADKGPLKDFNFIRNYIDTSSEERPFLPLFLTETISDYYYQSKPKKTREFIKGTRISGYKNQSVSQFLGSMYQNINIYDNEIPIFDIGFISPISNSAPLFYNYEVNDTIEIGRDLFYKVLFEPKREGEHTFRGEMMVHDEDYAVQKVSMQITGKQQINWVERINLVQEFKCFDDTAWFLIKDKFFVDFIASKNEKTAGFVGRKTTTYKDFLVNDKAVSAVINNKENKEDLVIEEKADERDETYWNSVRHDVLSDNEKAIYKMIDTIQSLPVYNKYYNYLYLLSTGIIEVGPIELGSFYNTYSTNPVEGQRVRFSIGTTPKLFKDIYINGYVAYGTKDKKTKFMGNLLWLLDRNPRRFINLTYKKDIDNSLSYYDNNAGSFDNIFNALGRKKGVPWKLVFINQKRLELFNESHNGFKQMLSFEHKTSTPYTPLPGINIFKDKDGYPTSSITTSEIGMELRFAYLEKFVEGNYWRTSIGTKYPLARFYAGLGLNNFLGSDYSYLKLRFSVSDYQNIPSLGKLYYNVFAGKVIGTLPYLLLEVHPGNEFYYYNGRTFNMMNRFEYISDTYAGAMVEHSLGSFFFKYIPYLRDTKIRTFWHAKGVYGGLTMANEALNFNKGFAFQSLSQSPYVELGTGIENIFRVLRIDCVWRVLPVSQTNDTPARRFGIFGSAKFEF